MDIKWIGDPYSCRESPCSVLLDEVAYTRTYTANRGCTYCAFAVDGHSSKTPQCNVVGRIGCNGGHNWVPSDLEVL